MTSAGVNGVPFEKRTPLRSVRVRLLPPFEYFQLVASMGMIVFVGENWTRRSKTAMSLLIDS